MRKKIKTKNFSLRLSEVDSNLLDSLADSLGCNRGEALRHLLRQQSKPDVLSVTCATTGQFAANGRTFRLKLRAGSVPND